MRCSGKSPEAGQRVAASSDPETAAGLVAAATVSEGCGVSLRGGPAICRALWDRRRVYPAGCAGFTGRPPRGHASARLIYVWRLKQTNPIPAKIVHVPPAEPDGQRVCALCDVISRMMDDFCGKCHLSEDRRRAGMIQYIILTYVSA